MRAKLAVLGSLAMCAIAAAEPGKHAQPELRLTADRLESEVTNTAPSISEEDEGVKAAAELPTSRAFPKFESYGAVGISAFCGEKSKDCNGPESLNRSSSSLPARNVQYPSADPRRSPARHQCKGTCSRRGEVRGMRKPITEGGSDRQGVLPTQHRARLDFWARGP